MTQLELHSTFQPAGDQPQAINGLTASIKNNKHQLLLGVTGSGKTFSIAHVLQNTKMPALIMAPNKTLAAQLYSEYKTFFPNNAIEYFVSFYDYYQPEAYVSSKNLYIEQQSIINNEIERMRNSAIISLLERKDVIVVASVSCIYGVGSPTVYKNAMLTYSKNSTIYFDRIIHSLSDLLYKRKLFPSLKRGNFAVQGENIFIFPPHKSNEIIKLSLDLNKISSIKIIDAESYRVLEELESVNIYSNSCFMTPKHAIPHAVHNIRKELEVTYENFLAAGKEEEAKRIKERTNLDIEMLLHTGHCRGIENYTRYISNSGPNATPITVIDYMPPNSIMVVDESHVSVPQIRGMHIADMQRKKNLIEHGYRLPSCLDNRPLNFDEWVNKDTRIIYVSATPGDYERKVSQKNIFEQIVRPTGLLDPMCHIIPTKSQIQTCMDECTKAIKNNTRVILLTLTKRMAEELSDYLITNNFKAYYIHSDVKTLERIEILKNLRQGIYDIIVGINLLREGIDIPECSLLCIFDADKAGYLRSTTSLIQMIGRVARNVNGKVIMFADTETDAMKQAISETNRRRAIQQEVNIRDNIKPTTISKPIEQDDQQESVEELEIKMIQAASDMRFELAAKIRDKITTLKARKK